MLFSALFTIGPKYGIPTLLPASKENICFRDQVTHSNSGVIEGIQKPCSNFSISNKWKLGRGCVLSIAQHSAMFGSNVIILKGRRRYNIVVKTLHLWPNLSSIIIGMEESLQTTRKRFALNLRVHII